MVGPAEQQDVELAAIFKDAENTYGAGKVLGILASKSDETHDIRKREAAAVTEESSSSLSSSSTTPQTPAAEEDEMEENFVYIEKSIYKKDNVGIFCATNNIPFII